MGAEDPDSNYAPGDPATKIKYKKKLKKDPPTAGVSPKNPGAAAFAIFWVCDD